MRTYIDHPDKGLRSEAHTNTAQLERKGTIHSHRAQVNIRMVLPGASD